MSRHGDLFSLAEAFQTRFHEQSHEPTDLDRAIDLFEQAADATPASPAGYSERRKYLFFLAIALDVRFRRYSDDRADLDRAIELFEQLAETSPLDSNRVLAMATAGAALTDRFERYGDVADSDQAITLAQKALNATPRDDPHWWKHVNVLFDALLTGYSGTGDLADLNRAIDLFDQTSHALDRNDLRQPRILSRLGIALLMRSQHTGDARDLDLATEVGELALRKARDDDPDRAAYLYGVGATMLTVLQRPNNAAQAKYAVVLFEDALAATEDPNRRVAVLASLAAALRFQFELLDDAGDLDHVLDLLDAALSDTALDRPHRPLHLHNLALGLRLRFQRHGNITDLDRAITADEEALALTPADHPNRCTYLLGTAVCLTERFDERACSSDLTRAVIAAREATDVSAAPAAVRGLAARQWGRSAVKAHDWDQAIRGYETAVELLDLAAPWALERIDQEVGLSAFAGLGSEAAAACVQAGQRGRAVELFEHARAILFTRLLDARSDLDDLAEIHPELAAEFVRCRDVLNRPTADPLAAPVGPVRAESQARRAASDAFYRVISQIRKRPGFEGFLTPPRVGELLSAAAYGPVVLLNVAPLRSDALILSAGDVTVVPLAPSYEDISAQVQAFLDALVEVLDARASWAARETASQVMARVLGWLGDTITGPVLDRLGYTTAPAEGDPLPRVWWCPGAELASMPVHAAGHHSASQKASDAVIDRVISSMIPSLRVLIHTRRPGVAQVPPKLLVVAMPRTAGERDLPGAAAEAATLEKIWPGQITVLGLSDDAPATVESVTANVPTHAWAHFACHGAPLEYVSGSHLLLQGGDLTAMDLTHIDLAEAELAFLSACTTAAVGARVPDEPINLAGACQLAGYRHVVGSLWPISDADTVWLAETFYGAALSATKNQADDAAEALHEATRQLRAINRDHPYLWAGYTHTGP
jgi:tetratricopeptide (TPR) repeat protein